MSKTKMLVIVLLAAITVINLISTVPAVLKAAEGGSKCECYRYGQVWCTGACCGGASLCQCYAIGADNCKAAQQ